MPKYLKLTWSAFTEHATGLTIPAGFNIYSDATKASDALARYIAAGATDAALSPMASEEYFAERNKRLAR